MWALSGFLQVNRHVYKGLYIHINHKVTLFTVEEFPAGFCCPGFFLFVFTFVQMQFKKTHRYSSSIQNVTHWNLKQAIIHAQI